MTGHLSWATGILSPVNMLFLGSLRLSLNFLSRASATISAALPLGQRMMGMVPEGGGGEDNHISSIPSLSSSHVVRNH